jgi:uncharacterized damage-inducible protein DinB
MTHKEHLLYMMQVNMMMAHRLIDDISEEESMVYEKDNCNHIRWQVGHFIHCDHYILAMLDRKPAEYDNYNKMFGGGSVLSDKVSDYPSMKDLREEYYKSHEGMINLISGMDEADFEKMTGEGDNRRPIWKPLTFLAMHELYHDGQIVITRKALGRDRAFD